MLSNHCFIGGEFIQLVGNTGTPPPAGGYFPRDEAISVYSWSLPNISIALCVVRSQNLIIDRDFIFNKWPLILQCSVGQVAYLCDSGHLVALKVMTPCIPVGGREGFGRTFCLYICDTCDFLPEDGNSVYYETLLHVYHRLPFHDAEDHVMKSIPINNFPLINHHFYHFKARCLLMCITMCYIQINYFLLIRYIEL